MPAWPTERTVLGTRVTRQEGPLKAAGRAKYTYDQNPTDLLHAELLLCPVGRARITRLDLTPAEGLPGVRAVWTDRGEGTVLQYHGDEVAAVAADTPQQAADAVRAIDFAYEALPHAVIVEEAMAEGAPQIRDDGNVRADDPRVEGDPDAALAGAAATWEGELRCQVVTHSCLEPHGAVAQFDGQRATIWLSTQAVHGAHNDLVNHFQLDSPNVEVICEHMGGGFGSKLGLDREAAIAARLSQLAGGRPVKLMRDREGEQTDTGCREYAAARMRIGVDADGKLVGLDAETWGSGGIPRNAGFSVPYIYGVPNFRRRHRNVAINAGGVRAMRAPGCPSASFIMESALDAVADELGLDPLELRRRNLPQDALWQQQLSLGAERIGWAQRQPSSSQRGRVRTGYGCAVTQWGGWGHESHARLAIHPDGNVEIWCGTQDLGTGSRTALAVVVAETLGLRPEDIRVHIGHSTYPPSGGSGGSTTIGGIASASRTAAEAARDELLQRVAAQSEDVSPDQLEVVPGAVRLKDDPTESMSWTEACALLGPNPISVELQGADSLKGGGVNGAQFARVRVDTDTGVTVIEKIVAMQDCGLIVNLLTAESQVYGGVIMGLSQALFEERVLDPLSGRMLNPNLEFYKLAGPSDIPEIEVHMQDQPERGVIGVGEPPAIPTAAAIANAVSNALGVRVTELPITPARVLGWLNA